MLYILLHRKKETEQRAKTIVTTSHAFPLSYKVNCIELSLVINF